MTVTTSEPLELTATLYGVGAAATLAVALRLRGPLLRPTSWSCERPLPAA